MNAISLPQNVQEIALALCEGVSTGVSVGVAIRIRYGLWDQLASMAVDSKHYLTADQYWRDVTIVSFLRKCAELPTTVDREAAALENFWKAESQCFRTNQRLASHLYGGLPEDLQDGRVRSFIAAARKIVQDVLGPCPDLLQGRFGPGATYGDRGKLTTLPDKISSCPTLTRACLPFLFQWGGTAWATACAARARHPTFVKGNRFTTVPKDCTKHRGIAIEPSINVFYQLALGKVMRSRLKSGLGIDLIDGQSVHRALAQRASREGHLATIDLSNASDTVSINLVKLLLPPRWFDMLSSLRSPYTLVKGRWILLEKFSSMGNGFTFELETLLFAALCKAVSDTSTNDRPSAYRSGIPSFSSLLNCELRAGENFGVYGDDIIVPGVIYKNVISVLMYFGFTPNSRKTFSEGNFRESCGGDYFDGVDVRPFFLKRFPNEPKDFFTIHNGLERMAAGHPAAHWRPFVLSGARNRVLGALPSSVRNIWGPKDLGDSVLHTDDKRKWTVKWKHDIRYLRTVSTYPFPKGQVKWNQFAPDVVLAAALYDAGWSAGEAPHSPVGTPSGDALAITPRAALRGYRVGWTPFS